MDEATTRLTVEAVQEVLEEIATRQHIEGVLRDLLAKIQRLLDAGVVEKARDSLAGVVELLDRWWVEDGLTVLEIGEQS